MPVQARFFAALRMTGGSAMPKRPRKPKTDRAGRPTRGAAEPTAGIRIIGGTLGGRRLRYQGDPRTRPMKDRPARVRFQPRWPGRSKASTPSTFSPAPAHWASRPSAAARLRATLIEQHRPTAAMIRQNLVELGVADRPTWLPATCSSGGGGAGGRVRDSGFRDRYRVAWARNPQIPKSLNP